MTTIDSPLSDLAAGLRNGQTRASELIAEAVDRHEAADEDLGAYQVWNPEEALARARAVDSFQQSGSHLRPLAGIPISVKDLFGVAGQPTYAGTSARLPGVWEREGFLVRRIREEMGVLVGKTKMVELAFGGLGNNPHWGTPINPWSAPEHRVPGGSSCGAGVSLWEGSAKVAIGTDTACSIRTPASMTGTVGFKPTQSRWPADGLVPLSSTLDTLGALTRTVADAAFFFAAVDPAHSGPDNLLARLGHATLAGLRIGIDATHAWSDCDPGISESVTAALRELEAHGASIVEIAFPEFNSAYALYMEGTIVPPEAAAFVGSCLPGWLDRLDPRVGDRIRKAREVTAPEYLSALSHRRQLIALAEGRMQAVDVLAAPTVPISPPLLSDIEGPDVYARTNRMASRTTNPANVLDLCAISIPCGLDDAGMPVGLQLIASRGEDERLLAHAYSAERVLGTARDRLGSPARCRGTVGQRL